MKNFLPVLLISVFAWQSCSRANTSTTTSETTTDATGTNSSDTLMVPKTVLDTFAYLFPAIRNASWGLEEGNYEVTFMEGDHEKSVVFSPEGKALITETQINPNSLPEAMLAYVAEYLKDKKVDQARMVITSTMSITYEIEVEGKDYIFSGEGKFLQIEESEGDEKD